MEQIVTLTTTLEECEAEIKRREGDVRTKWESFLAESEQKEMVLKRDIHYKRNDLETKSRMIDEMMKRYIQLW